MQREYEHCCEFEIWFLWWQTLEWNHRSRRQSANQQVEEFWANPFPEVTDLICRLPLPTAHQDYIRLLNNKLIIEYSTQNATEKKSEWTLNTGALLCIILVKPLHNHDIVSVHFNHFYCMDICDKLSRYLYMLNYIYLNLDECWLTSSMP